MITGLVTRKNRGFSEYDLLASLAVFACFFVLASIAWLTISDMLNGDDGPGLIKSDYKTVEELTKVIEAADKSSADPKEALAIAISLSDIHQDESTPVEAQKSLTGTEVSYRVAEDGDKVLATYNSESGKMCAVVSSNIGPVGGCVTRDVEPEAFKDPLNSIASDARLWHATLKQ